MRAFEKLAEGKAQETETPPKQQRKAEAGRIAALEYRLKINVDKLGKANTRQDTAKCTQPQPRAQPQPHQ